MPTHDIIDNRTHKLVDHIRQILPGSQAAKVRSGIEPPTVSDPYELSEGEIGLIEHVV